jgi:flagellar biosynthesis/type III secretory pathway protein FliH
MYLESLIQSVETSAEWRAGKAAQYPDDKRNRSSSKALFLLAKNLAELPADDKHVQAYEAIHERLLELDLISRVSEHESQYIGRYGFDYPQDGDPEDFLASLTEEYQEWVDEAEEEAAEEEREEAYEAACEAADEEAKEIADETAKEAAEEAAKEAAEEAYKEAYEEAYKEAYEEAYREALINAIQEAKTAG